MKKNMGNADRWIRAILGLAAIGAGIYFKSWWGALGIIFLATAFIGTCPLYMPFKLSTTKKDSN